MSQFISSLSCQEHTFDAALVERSDIDIESSADSGDILDIIRLVRHDRAASAREQYICNIIDRNVICDVVYQGYIASDIVDTFSQHFFPPYLFK